MATAAPTIASSTHRMCVCGRFSSRAPASRRLSSYAWGVSTDLPVPGDYDGDGRTDRRRVTSSTGHVPAGQAAPAVLDYWLVVGIDGQGGQAITTARDDGRSRERDGLGRVPTGGEHYLRATVVTVHRRRGM